MVGFILCLWLLFVWGFCSCFSTGRTGYIFQDRLMPESRLYKGSFWHVNPKLYTKPARQTCLMRNQHPADHGNQHNTPCGRVCLCHCDSGEVLSPGSSEQWEPLWEVRPSSGADPAPYVTFQITQALGSREVKSICIYCKVLCLVWICRKYHCQFFFPVFKLNRPPEISPLFSGYKLLL